MLWILLLSLLPLRLRMETRRRHHVVWWVLLLRRRGRMESRWRHHAAWWWVVLLMRGRRMKSRCRHHVVRRRVLLLMGRTGYRRPVTMRWRRRRHFEAPQVPHILREIILLGLGRWLRRMWRWCRWRRHGRAAALVVTEHRRLASRSGRRWRRVSGIRWYLLIIGWRRPSSLLLGTLTSGWW